MKPHLPSILSAETLDRRIEISFHPSMRPREPPFRSAAMGPGDASVRPCKAGDWICWQVFCGHGSEDKAAQKRSNQKYVSCRPKSVTSEASSGQSLSLQSQITSPTHLGIPGPRTLSTPSRSPSLGPPSWANRTPLGMSNTSLGQATFTLRCALVVASSLVSLHPLLRPLLRPTLLLLSTQWPPCELEDISPLRKTFSSFNLLNTLSQPLRETTSC